MFPCSAFRISSSDGCGFARRSAVGLDGEQHAALQQRPVDDHRAGAAVTRVAADVAAGEVEVVAEEVDQQLARLDLALVGRAVDGDRDLPRGRDSRRSGLHVGQLLARWDASLAARTARTSARCARYSLEACTSDGGSIRASRTAARTASGSADAASSTTGTASTQPSAMRTPPSTDAAALTMHVPSAPRVTDANPSLLPGGTVTAVSSSSGPTAVM